MLGECMLLRIHATMRLHGGLSVAKAQYVVANPEMWIWPVNLRHRPIRISGFPILLAPRPMNGVPMFRFCSTSRIAYRELRKEK